MAFGAPSLKGRALRYQAQREHSRAELARKLRRFAVAPQADGQINGPTDDPTEAGHADGSPVEPVEAAGPSPQAQIDTALDELAAHGLISDERAAASVLHSQGPRSGERRLKQVLQAKGLAPELVASTLALARGGEFERALALWQRRFGQPAASAAERARQARFLQGRGFGFDIISRVLRSAGAPVAGSDESPAD